MLRVKDRLASDGPSRHSSQRTFSPSERWAVPKPGDFGGLWSGANEPREPGWAARSLGLSPQLRMRGMVGSCLRRVVRGSEPAVETGLVGGGPARRA